MSQENDRRSAPGSPVEEADRRMADLAVFANGIAHDVRNPLSVIRTNVYLLRQGAAGQDPKAQRALQRIDEQINAALHLLNGIQAFDRAQNPAFQRVNVNELVRTVVGSTIRAEEIGITTGLDEKLPPVDADPQLLEAALRALIRNSLEALPGRGTIRIVSRQEGEALQISVDDDGPGVPEEIRTEAFAPFFSTRRAHAGLGLSLVERVARLHGGRAWIGSQQSKAAVVLELPLQRRA
jgi:signal transduction histidine kinase